MKALYDQTSFECSKLITQNYSTSFSLGIKTLHSKFHSPVYGVYGFVRYADEIVDTFHDKDKVGLLERFTNDTFRAISEGFSYNPVLHSFQKVVNQYNIPHELISAFLRSMEMDLTESTYDNREYETYIYGSAEVVGLMCLKVFCEGNEQLYAALVDPARSLGAAFQKVNFLRDMKSDFFERGRTYFPTVNFHRFTSREKELIEKDIQKDFDDAYQGIIKLPKTSRFGVYLAYIYYLKLFSKLKKSSAKAILEERIRIPNNKKMILLMGAFLRHRLNVI